MVIGFDMDGVIIENTASKIKFAKQLGFKLKPKDTPADVIEKIMPENILNQLRELLYHSPDTALEATVVPGAKSGLERIKKSNLRYFLISRRKDPVLAKQLLEKRGLWPAFFNEDNAFFVKHAEDKNIKAAELGVTLYIDDQPSVLEKLHHVPRRFLLDRFNVFNEAPADCVKVSSWKEFLAHL